MTQPTRFRLFYWLLDAATVATLFSVARYLYDPSVVLADQSGNWLTGIVGLLAVLLPAVLIFARPIRDEFAEKLWQAAAGTTLRGLIWIPLVMFFLWGVAEGLTNGPQSDPNAMISATEMLGLMLMLQLTVFVLSLQWHRWRAMRE